MRAATHGTAVRLGARHRRSKFMNVRDAFYEVLRAHGITTIFGNPGSNELPLLSDLPDDFRYVLALQEGAAIGMADGFAQATGRPALVNLHAAAGTGNAMGTRSSPRRRWAGCASGWAGRWIRSWWPGRASTPRPGGTARCGWPRSCRCRCGWRPVPPGARSPPATPTSGASFPRASPPSPATSRGTTSSLPSAPPIFMYHEFADGDYLPAGAELWAITSDPDEAARPPVGHILIGDPAEAAGRLADTIAGAGRPPLPAREPFSQADTAGPAFTEEAIMDAVNAAKTDSTVIAHEWTSTLVSVWDRLEITRPGSMYLSAAGGLGWGLPGAIGLQLGDPSRRVVALLGDGAVHYSISGLWTAAQHNIPVVFVVARNSEYRALKEFSRFMHDPDAPGMKLPGMDIPGIAAAYGVQSDTVKSLSDLTHAVKDGLSSVRPHLIEISQRRIGDS